MTLFTRTIFLAFFISTTAIFMALAPVPAPNDMTEEIINDIIQSVPSTLEITTLIKENQIPYHKSDLNDAQQSSHYLTNFTQAFNLGIYSTDLSYVNLYEKGQDGLNYLSAVQKLSKALSVDQFFDYKMLRNLIEEPENRNEILATLTRDFEKVSMQLSKEKRSSVRLLVITGAWLEATHLACKAYNTKSIEKLAYKIGEQKIVLGQLLLVMEVYRNEEGFVSLIQELKALQGLYDQVTIATQLEEPEMQEKDGELIFIDKSISTIDIDRVQIDAIGESVNTIRGKYIK